MYPGHETSEVNNNEHHEEVANTVEIATDVGEYNGEIRRERHV